MMQRITLVLLLSISIATQSQEKTITGIVSGSSGPLPGVSIIVKGSTKATETDFDGKYSIKANIDDILMFRYLGYKPVERKVTKSNVINVTLEEDSSVLEEVVVVGYGTVEKKSYTGSVSAIKIRGASSLKGKVSGVSVSDSTNKIKPQSGQLTAGEINDLSMWNDWIKIYNKNREFKKIRNNWSFFIGNRLDVEVLDKNNMPIVNADVFLKSDKNDDYQKMKTDINGRATFFRKRSNYIVQVKKGKQVKGLTILPKQKKVKFLLENKSFSNNIDVMFTVDATGSMGDEMNYLTSEIENIISRIDSTIEEKRVGLTFYRDINDEYVVKDFDFTTDISKVKKNLLKQSANGGGDYEEAVEKALEVSISKSWNVDAKAKLLFLLLDAPPHLNQENIVKIKSEIIKAKAKGIKIIPIVSSGADKTVEYLMRYFSIVTNGTYVFLTDDSGIGNPHLKPTKSKYKVEKLNDLIVRLIKKYSEA